MNFLPKMFSGTLSFALIFASVTPSMAQAVQSRPMPEKLVLPSESTQTDIRRQLERKETIEKQLATQVTDAQAEQLVHMTLLVNQARNAHLLGQEPQEEKIPTLDEFTAKAKEYLKPQLEENLRKCKTAEERQHVLAQWEDQTDAGALVNEYQNYLGKLGKAKAQAERELKEYLKKLSEAAVTYEQVENYKVKGSEQVSRSVDPVSEFLPLMASMGEEIVSKELKTKASAILRNRLTQQKRVCAGTNEGACQVLLRNASALAVLGTEQKDAFAIASVLEENFNSPQAASVIMAIGPMLLALDDIDPEYRAFAYVMDKIVRKAGEISYWEIAGAPLSAGAWVEAAHTASEGGVFARGYENSFYKDPSTKYRNMDNAWVNLGYQVAEESASHPALKRVVNRLVNSQLVDFRAGKNGIQTGTNHNLFLTGLLSGGYPISYQGSVAYQELDGQGRTNRAADTRGNAAGVNQKLREMNLTQSEWVAYVLYYTGKSDVEPYTERYLRNLLYSAFKRAERPASALGMEEKPNPSQSDLSSYERWQMAMGVANVVDIVLTAATILFIGAGVVKAAGSGMQMLRTLTRATRLARTARVANVGRLSSMGKALRAARYYKYGTYMLGPDNATFVASLKGTKFTPNLKAVGPRTPVKAPSFETVNMGNKTVAVAFTPEQEAALMAQRADIAPKTFASTGAPAANTAKVQPISSPQPLDVVADPSFVPTENTPYMRGKVLNALGQEVEVWVKNPNYKLPLADTPARQLRWLDRAQLKWEMNMKPALRDMLGFGTSRYGLAALGPGVAPLSSEAAIAEAGNAVEVVQNIRAQQGMFITEEALKGGAGASYRVGAVNQGGMAAANVENPAASTASAVRPWLQAGALIPASVFGASLLFGSDAGVTDGLQTALAVSPLLAVRSWTNKMYREGVNRLANPEKQVAPDYSLTKAYEEDLAKKGLKMPQYYPIQEVKIDSWKALGQVMKNYPLKLGSRQKFLKEKENKNYRAFAASIMDREPRIAQIMNEVQTSAAAPSASEEPSTWLAKQVPTDTNVLCIGEGFYWNPAVPEAMPNFLDALRKQMPDREIIMITSHLDKGIALPLKPNKVIQGTFDAYHAPVWQAAQKNNISVIGAKEQTTTDGPELFGFSKPSPSSAELFAGTEGVPFWRSWSGGLEANTLRRDRILKQLKTYRKKSPGALFVLYLSKEQASFTFPFSVVNKLEQQEKHLYVINITSATKVFKNEDEAFPEEDFLGTSTRTTLFESIYPQAQLSNVGAVSRNVAKDIGHDAWMKVAYDPANRDYGAYYTTIVAPGIFLNRKSDQGK